MEIKKEEHPLKIRSARACVSAGFRLYLGNFRRIFRTTWLPALICALAGAFYTQIMISTMTQLLTTQTQMVQGQVVTGLMQYLVLSGVSILYGITLLVFFSYVFSMLSRHRTEGTIPYPASWLSRPDGRMLLRTIAVAMVWFVAEIIVYIVCGAVIAFGAVRQSLTTIAVGLLLLLVMTALLLPLVYPSMHYLSTRDTRLFDLLGKGYRQGLQRWGFIFAVLFVVMIILFVILCITMLPAIILSTAGMKAEAGVLIGDPLGMPSYMGWMSFLVYILSGFIQCYIILSMLFPAYYMAGAIEQQEIQRNEKTKNTLY